MKKILPFILLFLSVLTSCKQVLDFYIGIPLQPKFEDDSYVPGLNIFGIIRTDSTLIYNNSFVQVQKVIMAVGDSDSLEVDTTGVIVSLIQNSISIPYPFSLTNHDSAFSQPQYRPASNFMPQPGETYAIECDYPDLPLLKAQTIIPQKAQVIRTSVNYSGNQLYFELLQDSSIYMIDVYVFSRGERINFSRFPASQNENTVVEFGTLNAIADSLVLFSYDYNLAKYYLTSNTSLNFNKYRESFGTVQNGYGVFGSVNKNYFLFDK